MTRQEILEDFFSLVYESCEWGFDTNDKEYSNYISGLTDMTFKQLERVKEEFTCGSSSCYQH